MAGSFGYEAEHYDVSREIGEELTARYVDGDVDRVDQSMPMRRAHDDGVQLTQQRSGDSGLGRSGGRASAGRLVRRAYQCRHCIQATSGPMTFSTTAASKAPP